jgi:hypothetical protein
MIKNQNRFVWRGLAALLLVGLIVVGAFAAHYVGWSQGYTAGQLTAEGEEVPAPGYLPYGQGFPGRPYLYTPHLLGGGVLIRVLLLIFFFVVIGKLIRFVVWGAMWGPAMAGPWGHRTWHRAAHWHRAHGPMPPGGWWWTGPPDEEAGETDAEPGAEA